MTTAEDNADRIPAKLAAFSFRAARRGCVFGVWLSIGLVACSYRAQDKAALHAKTVASEPMATVAAKPQAIAEENSILDAQSASASPQATKLPAAASAAAHAGSSKRSVKNTVASIDRVVGDASVTLFTPAMVDVPDDMETPAGNTSHVVTTSSEQARAPAFPWNWLLAALVVIAAAATVLARHRRRGADRCVPAQAVASEDAGPSALEDASGSVSFEAAPAVYSSLEWTYQPPDYETREHWDAMSPVDFLPVSLAAYVSHEVEEQGELPSISDETEETRFVEEIGNESAPSQEEHPLLSFFDRLEATATVGDGDMPVLLIERDSDLPEVLRTSGEPIPAAVLETWENLLRQAMPEAETFTLPWLLVAVLLLQADNADHQKAESLYAEAERWIELSMVADVAHSAAWEARRIAVDLCRAKRQKGAARLLSLRGMPSRHAQVLAQAEPPVLFAWIDVLAFWAECQFGDAALARYAEAEAICVRLCEVPSSAATAQRRRAEILRRRATIEEGGARLKSLDTAQALLDLLYERAPNADNALAVAVTALTRGNVLPPEQAREAYSHALMHAFMAEAEPRLRAESLQCRLAVQWAYENLPGMPVESDVATNLATRLEALHVRHPETLQRMAQIHLRNADFARAAELCEKAWRSGQATPALLATWRDTCAQWGTVAARPEQLVARQQAVRQLSIASAMR